MKIKNLLPLSTFLVLAHLPISAAENVWTDPDTAAKEDPDFSIQGEYMSANSEVVIGAQVIALGKGKFQAYLLQDGLPGKGWTPEKSRTFLEGMRDGDGINFTTTADSQKKLTATIKGGQFIITTPDGKASTLARIQRSSQTLGAKPPKYAVVLFDGKSPDLWENGKLVNENLLSIGCTSKQSFKGYTLHLEFRTPYMPQALGQGRGNSGIYHTGRWETQILDSFGLDGKDNECGGIYSVSQPRLNMCLPPLSWQTYDVELTPATFDDKGTRTTSPKITVKLNGELIHENLELKNDNTAAAPIGDPLTSKTQGPIYLQDHGNPVAFRNIWVIPK